MGAAMVNWQEQWPACGTICYGVFSGVRLEPQARESLIMRPIIFKFQVAAVAFAIAIPWSIALAQSPPAETLDATDDPAAKDRPSDSVRQEQALVGGTSGPSPALNAASAKAAFDSKFQEYRGIVREIEKLQVEYQTADKAEREGINAAMTGQVAHAQSIINEMIEAGVEAFRQAPNDTPQIKEFLNSVARHYVVGRQGPGGESHVDGGDQYERALPIINTLVEGGAATRDLLLWGFLSAFATNDYALAEEFLQKAQNLPPTKGEDAASDAANDATMGLVAKFAPMLPQYRQWWETEAKLRAAEAAADDLPRVKLTTTKGEITLELFENEAPQTVANFLTLVKQGYFNGLPFHRVIAKFMAQGGAKNDDGSGRLGYSIRGEAAVPNHRRHFRGSLSMGLLPGNPDSGGSQFFLTLVPTPHLDGQHTVFGRIIEGVEVPADMNRREPTGDPSHDGQIPAADRIIKAEVIRDRGHEYKFDKLSEP
jgi:cyclophilin family peptidyl-prolyl cis-trans isomerase